MEKSLHFVTKPGIFVLKQKNICPNGTGIGLALAKKIVASHNKIITVNDELNQGTTLGIYLLIVQK